MIVLDASVLIAFFDASDAWHERAGQLLIETADQQIAASVITLAEVLVGPARAGKLELAETVLQELGVVSLALPEQAAAQLARLRAESGLRIPDCCVLLTAARAGAAIATFDRRLAAAAQPAGVPVVA